jgi:4-methyl-5(b-hydroxyethyl)-thiazole monophosphate biosynthesis
MKKAIVLVTDGSEELEAVTIIDILRRGGINVTVSSVSSGKLVHCANGTKLEADSVLSDGTDLGIFDLLVLPGGSVAAETYSKVCTRISFSTLNFLVRIPKFNR